MEYGGTDIGRNGERGKNGGREGWSTGGRR